MVTQFHYVEVAVGEENMEELLGIVEGEEGTRNKKVAFGVSCMFTAVTFMVLLGFIGEVLFFYREDSSLGGGGQTVGILW